MAKERKDGSAVVLAWSFTKAGHAHGRVVAMNAYRVGITRKRTELRGIAAAARDGYLVVSETVAALLSGTSVAEDEKAKQRARLEPLIYGRNT